MELPEGRLGPLKDLVASVGFQLIVMDDFLHPVLIELDHVIKIVHPLQDQKRTLIRTS